MKTTRKLLALLLGISLLLGMFGCAAKPAETETPVVSPTVGTGSTVPMKAGTYSETVTGMSDGLVVETTVGETLIEKVEVISSNETAGISDPAIEQIPAKIVEMQSIKVDVVSGATRTSEGIIAAVSAALEEAGAKLEDFTIDSGVQTAAAVAWPVMGSFEVPTTWDESYDVVVVGSGFAGMAAAYSAKTAGANTVLIEKQAMTGGNSATNGGQYAAYTSKIAAGLQTELNLVPDTAEKHIEDTMKGGDYMSNLDLVENMVYGAPYFFDLLLDNGLEVRNVLARPGGHYGYRTYVTVNQVGSDITNVQHKMVVDAGVPIELETKMVEIYRTRDEANRVVGIKVQLADGTTKNIEAKKGLILATGGFGANVEMRQTQVPYLTADIPTTNKPATTGEGIMLAEAIGANTTQMSNIQRYPFADARTGVLDKYAVWPFTGPSYGIVYVDYQGNRYVSEGERRDVCANAAANSGFISTYAIFTEELAKWAKPEEIVAGVESGRVLKADTLEELAEKINAYDIKGQYPQIDGATLKATIEKHNSYIDSGVDPDFNKVMANTMVKMEAGPYYAVSQYPSVHHTMGGLVINRNTEVVDIFGNVIPGLYAAGEVTGGVHGTNRLGSNADADCCANGYISGYMVTTGKLPDFIPQD